jgi:starch phosphorylase
MATTLPRFNSGRMVDEYVSRFYAPASLQARRYEQDGFAAAKHLSAWKKKVRFAWSGLTLSRMDVPLKRISFGEAVRLEVALNMNGLAPEDVVVELLIRRPARRDKLDYLHFGFNFSGMSADGKEHLFALDLAPDLCGRLDYKIRVYPFHQLLTHPLEMGLMQWL